MKKLIERFSGLVKGTITGFDRPVFSTITGSFLAMSENFPNLFFTSVAVASIN